MENYEDSLNKISKTKENFLIIIDFLNYSLNDLPLGPEQVENNLKKLLEQKENDKYFIEALRRIIISRYYYYHLYNAMWLKNNFEKEYKQYRITITNNNNKSQLSTHELLINFLWFLSKQYQEKTMSSILRRISHNIFRLKKQRNIADYELVSFLGIETFEEFLELHNKTLEKWNILFSIIISNN